MPNRMSRGIAPYRTPLDLFMYLNDLSEHQVAQATGLSRDVVHALRAGTSKSLHHLQRIEHAFGVPRGTLGGFARVFRRTDMLWYRVAHRVTGPKSKCVYCKQFIEGIEVVYTLPWRTQTDPMRFHYDCFLKAWAEIREGVVSAMQSLIERTEEVEYEERGWYGGSWQQQSEQDDQADQHHAE